MINLNEEPNVDQFIDSLTDKDLIVYEDIQGSKLYVNYDGSRFIIKPRSYKNEELNFVDLAIQSFYGQAYKFFHTLPCYVTDILDKNWWFCFEYMVDNKPANIEYNHIPKNNLILTSIVKNNKHTFNYEEITEYAKLFNVDSIPLIFSGKLNDKQLQVIRMFLKTSDEDLKFIFGEDNFTKFFYDILNPYTKSSFLMVDGQYNDNLERIVIKTDDDVKYTFEILNPMYQKQSVDNYTEYSQVYSLIVVNFLEFLQLKPIDKYTPKGLTKDEMYINLICDIFNDYMSNIIEDIEKWDIALPIFLKQDKYKLNISLIRDKKTRELIKISDKVEYVFKVILGTFNKKRKKPIGVINENTIVILNQTVDKINKHIENLLNINREYRFQKIDMMNFADYFDLKFDKDGAGEIYPDISVQFEEEHNKRKKKSAKKK